ncbi:MAG: hypothetical protein LBS76_01590 [Mycoplasmataceae bacterium]|jgi:protein required for attachment to host cells|nr:hypothetical protein [Mycoplasmataceae bacterium]
MEQNNNITPDQIAKMSEQEWQEFRHKSWERKGEYYSKEVPDWYLRSQESFAQFLERKQPKR